MKTQNFGSFFEDLWFKIEQAVEKEKPDNVVAGFFWL